MALTDKLTAIADAIRTKTGSTEKLTLAQMPTEIAGIQAGGGGVSIEGANVYEITIGANSITNAFDGYAYIEGLVKKDALVMLNSIPTINNQLVTFFVNKSTSSPAIRYRGGVYTEALKQTAYDGVLVEGTVYTVFEFEV